MRARFARLGALLLALGGSSEAAAAQVDADFTATPTSGTQPLLVQFTDTSTGGPFGLRIWDFGDGTTSTAAAPAHLYTASQATSFTVSLTVFSPNGVDTETKVDFVTVQPAPLVADFTATPVSGVNPLTVQFTDLSGGAPLTGWSWDFGDGSTSAAQNPVHTYEVATTTSFTVELTVSSGPQTASTTAVDLVTVDPAPLVVDFTATPVQGPPPLAVSFTDTSSGAAITGWSWDFGDGTTSTLQSPTHVYPLPGTYTVSLTASVGPQSGTLTETDLVTVDLVPLTVDFTATPTTGTNPLGVSFTDASVVGAPGPTGWLWSFGDGQTSTLQNPFHQYTLPGTYDVSLTVSVGQQQETLLQPGLVSVAPAVFSVEIASPAVQGVNPLTVAFEATSTGTPPTGWIWDFGDGAGSILQNPVHTYTTPGVYDVTVTGYIGAQPESATLLQAVTVDPAPLVVDFAVDTTEGTNPLSVSFTNLSSGAAVTGVSWDFGDGSTSTEENPTHLYSVAESGSFTVSLTAFVGGQAETLTVPDLVTVDVPFTRHELTSPGDRANDLALADLDGDGDLDVVAALTDSDTVGWFANTGGNGAFGPVQVVDPSTLGPNGVATGDLDGDGDPDVLTSDFTAREVLWSENLAAGSFAPSVVVGTPAGRPSHVLAVDLDVDGDLDVLLTASVPAEVLWHANTDGAGAFGPEQAISAGLEPALDLDAGDLDGDGDADVVISTSNDSSVRWFRNGGGTFGAPVVLDGAIILPRDVELADLDGDGDTDVLAASRAASRIRWYENLDGAGTFAAPQTALQPVPDVERLLARDMDGDGDPDLLYSRRGIGDVAWNANLGGTGVFGPVQFVTTTLSFVDSLVAGDLDGDGDVDVGAHPSLSAPGYWYENPLASPAWPFLGQGLAGTNGIPVLVGSGELSAGEDVSLILTGSIPTTPAVLVIGFSRIDLPILGGTLVPFPDFKLKGLFTDATGGIRWDLVWPPGLAPDTTLWFQYWMSDPLTPQGLSASNGTRSTSPR